MSRINQFQNILTATAYAQGPCTGLEYVPAWNTQSNIWATANIGTLILNFAPVLPAVDLWVVGVSVEINDFPVGTMTAAQKALCWTLCGISNPGDVVSGVKWGCNVAWDVFFPQKDYAMKLFNQNPIVNNLIDIHLQTPAVGGCNWEVRLTAYTVPATL